MEKVHRELIQVNYLKLTKAIRLKVVEVAKYLSQEKLISDTMEEDIVYQRTPSEQAYKLLDIIQTRGPRAFGILYKAVCESMLWDAADILEPAKAPHDSSETAQSSTSKTSSEQPEEDEPLPDNWPTESHLIKVESMKLNVKKIEEDQTRMIARFQNPNKKETYALNQKCKGRVLIIDNEEFTKGLPNRTGSSQDTRGLNCLFQALNFDVCVRRNKTKEEMERILADECGRNFIDTGCFILIMLSHGVRRKVFGTDGFAPKDGTSVSQVENYVEIDEIKKSLSEVEGLKGKPKMLIIQACQSDVARTSDHEQLVEESSAANINSTNQHGNLPSNSSNPLNLLVTQKTHPEATGPQERGQSMDIDLHNVNGEKDNVDSHQTYVKVPADGSDSIDGKDSNANKGNLATDASLDSGRRPHQGSDMFTALATIEGQPSYRNTAFGSWFIQAFIYVLERYAYKHELSSLMKKVTQLVMKARSRKDESQVCETRSTMDKDFYFFPGLSVDSP